ncbi:Gmad2 immunoglobulin-like domain-containing protein [Pseudalkalibacillus berkeleyi]|uniref:Gmad2 immunoglobulin-like domain-containing protein n=1 Tax=Pseudalkalibacillus berkeleyi TaxID=1069813 RepID=A0ABS9H3J7_9BACL|nr:Gmad2 immunoglobulin-like domain-containing protein [Pseudalkalibacillus berkeleyi]MCF6138676.1 Gmad2 immunoglobulin-like domain-containing protein [Pseudalkalibacillus berkeleyi]
MKRILVMVLVVMLGLGAYQMYSNQDIETPVTEDQQNGDDQKKDPTPEAPAENDAFKIESPRPNEMVSREFLFKGKARVFEASFQYELKDGENVIESDFLMASEGAPAWGDFEKTISVPESVSDQLVLKVFVESAKDGSEINIIEIPLKVE